VPALAFAAAEPGWQTIDLPSPATYYLRYLPTGWDPAQPAPLIVFLHGAGGGGPDYYPSTLYRAADRTGAVVVAPRSQGIGWGAALDEATIAEVVRLTQTQVAIDPDRISLAGHSAGGAYAYLLAYDQVAHWSAVFTLAAPYYFVPLVADPEYTAPIRMFYGTADPNYGAAFPRLVEQWLRLGVPATVDIRQQYGHNNWPNSSMEEGFEFLVAQRYPSATCVAGATALCLLDARFRVELTWTRPDGSSGAGNVAVGAGTQASGLFWFFDAENWEMLVKVLDGCALNGQRWVFAAATTDVAFTLAVTDTQTGAIRTYENPAGQAARPIQDTEAFPCSAALGAPHRLASSPRLR
jgi:predicted esterase